jgi:hypothetical protein
LLQDVSEQHALRRFYTACAVLHWRRIVRRNSDANAPALSPHYATERGLILMNSLRVHCSATVFQGAKKARWHKA